MQDRASADQVRTILIAAAEAVIDHKDALTKADQAIGDGDHGVGMARGFKAFREALERDPQAKLPDLFKAGGQAIMMTSGGASGVIFGTFFIGAGKAIEGDALDGPAFAAALAGGLDAVCARGKAKVGEKTMVDALSPAVDAARAASRQSDSLAEVADRAASAAETGLEETKTMIATTGKAKSLGERSLGFVDPGALTVTLVLKSIAKSLAVRSP